MRDGTLQTRDQQTRRVIAWLRTHPYTTSYQIMRAMGWTGGMWAAVRKHAIAHADAGGNCALVGYSVKGRYVWWVTTDSAAAVIWLAQRLRDHATRARTIHDSAAYRLVEADQTSLPALTMLAAANAAYQQAITADQFAGSIESWVATQIASLETAVVQADQRYTDHPTLLDPDMADSTP